MSDYSHIMFSNGMEEMLFMERNSYECPHFIEWDKAEREGVDPCHVEHDIGKAWFQEEFWPTEWLDREKVNQIPECRRKKGLGPKH